MENVFMNVGVLVMMLAGVLGLLYWLQRKQHHDMSAQKRDGLAAVRNGMTLITCVQQHRGMSAALLSGDKSFLPRLVTTQDQVANAIRQVADILGIAAGQGMAKRRFAQISQAWLQLQQQVQSLTPEQSFNRHTALIRQILYLLGDMGERAGLLEGHLPAQTQLAEVLLLRLPLLIESVGQARALGSASAAKGVCGAVGRIRLAFLLQRIRNCQTKASIVFEVPALSTPANRCQEKVDVLQSIISTRILGSERIDLAPEAYFRMATDTIEACLALWQATATLIEQGANARLADGLMPA